MDISTIGGISSTSTSTSTQEAGALGKDDFLNLLLKQLSYQDPLNPMDSAEFTAQLSQFSSLEELTNINTTLNDVLSFQQSMQNASVANLIGKTVTVDGNAAFLSEDAEINYELSAQAASVEITIYDGSGRVVSSKNIGSQEAGEQRYTWDGKDSAGNQLPEGSYTFQVDAVDISGNPVQAVTSGAGTVTEVVFEEGLTYIVLDGGIKVNLSDIKSIG